MRLRHHHRAPSSYHRHRQSVPTRIAVVERPFEGALRA
jgi:hypothetical protein